MDGVRPPSAWPLSDDEIRALVPPEDYRLPDGRIIEEAAFLDEIAAARRDHVSETSGLADRFTWCMAAPINDAQGMATRTLCLVLPIDTPEMRRKELLGMLRERARGVSLSGA